MAGKGYLRNTGKPLYAIHVRVESLFCGGGEVLSNRVARGSAHSVETPINQSAAPTTSSLISLVLAWVWNTSPGSFVVLSTACPGPAQGLSGAGGGEIACFEV